MKSLLLSALAAAGGLIFVTFLLRVGAQSGDERRVQLTQHVAHPEANFPPQLPMGRDFRADGSNPVKTLETPETNSNEPQIGPLRRYSEADEKNLTSGPTPATPRNIAGPKTTIDSNLTSDEQQTVKETGVSDTSLRNADWPRTYISSIHIDLASPNHSVVLTWSGPKADSQERGPFHSSPGAGLGYNNCDDTAESLRTNSNCTPKGTAHIQAFSQTMTTSPECRFVSWFDADRGVALHYYPFVPNYPASHGCVRLRDMHAAQLIHNNSIIGATEVVVEGKWKRGG